MGLRLVTGVTGQDGSYLAEKLLAQGHIVHGLVNPTSRNSFLPKGLQPHYLDLADINGLQRLISKLNPEQIFHVGGMSSIPESWQQPIRAIEVNGVSTLALLDSAWKLHTQGQDIRVVLASSSEVFGNPATPLQDEKTPISPINPYGLSKSMAHQAIMSYRARGMHASALYLYNHESPRRLHSSVVRKITRSVAAINLGWQAELELSSLAARRDWGWAPEYVTAYQLAADAESPDDYVIASGVTHSIKDVVVAAFDYIGIQNWERFVKVNPANQRPIESTLKCGDASKARRVLGWEAPTDFRQVIENLVDYDLADLINNASAKVS